MSSGSFTLGPGGGENPDNVESVEELPRPTLSAQPQLCEELGDGDCSDGRLSLRRGTGAELTQESRCAPTSLQET